MTQADRELCGGLAALLRCGSLLGGWSGCMTFLAGLSIIATGTSRGSLTAAGLTAFVGCLGIAGRWLTARVKLDAQLFEGLAAGRIATLQSLDTALAGLGLVKAGGRSSRDHSRSLRDRQQGALALLKRQALCIALQTALMFFLLVWIWQR